MYIEASIPPDCRSARNNLYFGISLVRQVRSLISLPCSVSLCFWSFLFSSFWMPLRFPFRFPFRIPFRIPFHFPFRFPFRIPFRFTLRFPFRIPFHFPIRFTYRIPFHDPRFSTDPRSGSHSRFCFRLALLTPAPPTASRFAPTRRCFI